MRKLLLFVAASAFTLVASRGLEKRSCQQGSWKASGDVFTVPSNVTQAVAFGISGPSRILVTKPRRESWTNTMGLSFEEAKSLNTNLELVETFEDVEEKEVLAGEHEYGNVGFTSFFYCQSGTATCNGEEVSGDICTPKLLKLSRETIIDGAWHIVLGN